MKRKEIKDQFKNGLISKADFIDEMYQKNKDLFEYVQLLAGTDISSIEITEKEVLFTSKEDGIKISCMNPDKRTAPFEIMNFDEYESADAYLLFQLIKDGDTIFDIGANIGWYSISMSKRFPKSDIYSFEPLKRTYENLRRNIHLNQSSKIQTFNFGFSNQNTTLVFYSSPHTSVSNSSQNITGGAEIEAIECDVKIMDDFMEDKNITIDFIKCDVEGAELFVYRGGIQTLQRHQPIIFTEMLRKWASKFGYHPNDIINLFYGIGYSCFYGQENKFVEITEVTDSTIATNYFFLHKVKHRNLIQSIIA